MDSALSAYILQYVIKIAKYRLNKGYSGRFFFKNRPVFLDFTAIFMYNMYI